MNAGATVASCILGCLVFVAVLAVLVGVTGGLFMLLWNAVVPPIFGLTSITIWQALGLWFLIYIIGVVFFATVRKTQGSS